MQRSSTIFMAKCVTILAVIPAVILASASGPEARHTGAPGDLGTCTACHAARRIRLEAPSKSPLRKEARTRLVKNSE